MVIDTSINQCLLIDINCVQNVNLTFLTAPFLKNRNKKDTIRYRLMCMKVFCLERYRGYPNGEGDKRDLFGVYTKYH